jgi:hypothetical protein
MEYGSQTLLLEVFVDNLTRCQGTYKRQNTLKSIEHSDGFACLNDRISMVFNSHITHH